MRPPHRVDRQLATAVGFAGLAAAGWSIGSTPLAVVGAIGALSAVAFHLWQRYCLTGLTYRRHLGRNRAEFGEEVRLDLEFVNDKILPLAWVQVEDDVPAALDVGGGTVIARTYIDRLVHVIPLLPYQRVRRHLTVSCVRRGEHLFGPATMTSGDPIGLRTRSTRLPDVDHLLVFPKIFALEPTGIASRVLLGEVKSRYDLLEDPSRIAGVREYRAGDPLRSVDWRASARSSALLVRQFEPTASLRVAVFGDLSVPTLGRPLFDPPELEFTIALLASLVADFSGRGIPVGLFSAGLVSGRPVAHPPSSSPAALGDLLEDLARISPFGRTPFAEVASAHAGDLHRGTSVLVVAAHYPEATLAALDELRRRFALTAVFVSGAGGDPPPPGLVDTLLTVEYCDDWQTRQVLELAH